MNDQGTAAPNWQPDSGTNAAESRPAIMVPESAKRCHVCGQPPPPMMDFHPSKQDCIRALRGRVVMLERGLNVIASWAEGDQVQARFDEPASAKIARDTLGGRWHE